MSVIQQYLHKRLSAPEEKPQGIAFTHDSYSCNTRVQLKQLVDALRELATPPDPPKRPIGFVNHEGKE